MIRSGGILTDGGLQGADYIREGRVHRVGLKGIIRKLSSFAGFAQRADWGFNFGTLREIWEGQRWMDLANVSMENVLGRRGRIQSA